MENEMKRQLSILNALAELLHMEADGDYDSLNCRFTPMGDEGERTASTAFIFHRDGVENNVGISSANIFEIVDLAIELQSEMKAHTGGEWSEFSLKIDENGEAKTSFKYEDQLKIK